MQARAVARARRVLVGCRRRRLSSSAAPASQTVVSHEGPNYRLLTLNREKALNAANLPMIRELAAYFDTYEPNPTIHAMVLRGAGHRAFCAGGDVKALYDDGQNDATRGEAFAFFAEEYLLNYKLATSATPVVSFIDGIVMGGGVGLSLPGQYRVATPSTVFAMPETAIGFFPDVGGSFYLPRLHGGAGVGTWLGLTGARLKGVDVLHAGIATHFVNNESTMDQMLGSISEGSDAENSELNVFQALMAGLGNSTPSWFLDNMERIDRAFSADSVEEVIANLEEDGDEWAQQTLAKLRKVSPLSVKVTFELLRRGAQLSVADALKMEFRVSQHMMEGKDFFEGVRSVLVDRDHAPQWTHESVEAVTADEVEAYFQAPEGGGKFELELPTERGDSVAFPPAGKPTRQELLASQLAHVHEWSDIGHLMADQFAEIDAIRAADFAREDAANAAAKQKNEMSQLGWGGADGFVSRNDAIRDEILEFKRAKQQANKSSIKAQEEQ